MMTPRELLTTRLGDIDDALTDAEDWLDDYSSSCAGEGDTSARKIRRALSRARRQVMECTIAAGKVQFATPLPEERS